MKKHFKVVQKSAYMGVSVVHKGRDDFDKSKNAKICQPNCEFHFHWLKNGSNEYNLEKNIVDYTFPQTL